MWWSVLTLVVVEIHLSALITIYGHGNDSGGVHCKGSSSLIFLAMTDGIFVGNETVSYPISSDVNYTYIHRKRM